MQKAIYYVSKLIAARGIVELTDRHLNFQVSGFDASFGLKGLSIDLCSISDIKIGGGELHPKVVVVCGDKRYEFVLAKAQEFYDDLKELRRNPLRFNLEGCSGDTVIYCDCGKRVSSLYRYCPWCGTRLNT